VDPAYFDRRRDDRLVISRWPLHGQGHGEQLSACRLLGWIEERLDTGPQTWKQYSIAMLLFSTVSFVAGFAVLALQLWLPLNQQLY
jgi:K+-transporting ATPase ATPase A chain